MGGLLKTFNGGVIGVSVKCLYYPYSRAIDLTTLKKAILLFDEVAFLDSESPMTRGELMEELVSGHEKEELEIAYDFLIKEEIVTILQPSGIIEANDQLLTLNILNDVFDDDFFELAYSYSSSLWGFMGGRIPPSFLEAVRVKQNSKIEGFRILNQQSKDIHRMNLSVGDFFKARKESKTERAAFIPEAYREDYRYAILENHRRGRHLYEVPFPLGASIRLNEALLMCSINDYIPFTDSTVHDKLLMNKVSRALEEVGDNPNLRDYLETSLPLNLPKQHLSLIILDNLIPEEELSKRSLQELIEYRNENRESLRRLREKIAEVSVNIELGKEGVNYYASLQRLMDSKIVPEITKTRDEIVKKYEEAFGRLKIRSVGTVASSLGITAAGGTLATNIFAGMSLTQILIACAVAQTGMLASVGANELVKIRQAKKDERRNSFSYLTNLKR